MKLFLLFSLLVFTGLNGHAQQNLQILSPDKSIRVEIKANDGLKYSVFVDDKKVLNDNRIDMNLADGGRLSANLKKIKEKRRVVHETIVAQVPVSRKLIPDEFNELSLHFNNQFAIIFRAYNDGVAYRIVTSFPDSITVTNEKAEFKFMQVHTLLRR